jgi:hypothetical protein
MFQLLHKNVRSCCKKIKDFVAKKVAKIAKLIKHLNALSTVTSVAFWRNSGLQFIFILFFFFFSAEYGSQKTQCEIPKLSKRVLFSY